MFENKTSNDANLEVIEIVSSNSELALLKRSDNHNLKISFPLCLCIGKLSGMNHLNRHELAQYFPNPEKTLFKNGLSFQYEYNQLLKYASRASKIRIWSSHLDCDDYCLLLYLCHVLKDQTISVIYSEALTWDATTLGCLSPEDVKQLSQTEHLLTKEEQEYFSNEWLKLIDVNQDLRFMINGQVISCNIDYFDQDILQRLAKLGQVNIYALVADLIGNPIIPNVQYADWIYLYLINRLIDNHLIAKSFKNNKIYLELIR